MMFLAIAGVPFTIWNLPLGWFASETVAVTWTGNGVLEQPVTINHPSVIVSIVVNFHAAIFIRYSPGFRDSGSFNLHPPDSGGHCVAMRPKIRTSESGILTIRQPSFLSVLRTSSIHSSSL